MQKCVNSNANARELPLSFTKTSTRYITRVVIFNIINQTSSNVIPCGLYSNAIGGRTILQNSNVFRWLSSIEQSQSLQDAMMLYKEMYGFFSRMNFDNLHHLIMIIEKHISFSPGFLGSVNLNKPMIYKFCKMWMWRNYVLVWSVKLKHFYSFEFLNDDYVLGGIYRHPNGNAAHFIDDLEMTIQSCKII